MSPSKRTNRPFFVTFEIIALIQVPSHGNSTFRKSSNKPIHLETFLWFDFIISSMFSIPVFEVHHTSIFVIFVL